MKRLLFVIFLGICCSACGGSGGGGGDSDSGSLDISVDPGTISPGTLAFVDVNFSDVDFDDRETQGITVKLIVPNKLDFVNGSSSITLDQGATLYPPLFVGPAPHSLLEAILQEAGLDPLSSASTASNFSFVIFSVPGWMLTNQDNGHIKLNLNVTGIPEVPYIFADLDRGALGSFDAANSNFDKELETEVEVIQPTPENSE